MKIFIYLLAIAINIFADDLSSIFSDDFLSKSKYSKDELKELVYKCDLGDIESCRSIAVDSLYIDFRDRKSNIEAEKIFIQYMDKACKLGHGGACYDVGIKYADPRHFPYIKEADIELGLKYLIRGCDLKTPISCGAAGFKYGYLAKSASKDDKKKYLSLERLYFKKACKLGGKIYCDY